MIKLFFSYSHKDEGYRNELETHLALLKRQGVISSWHDRRILAGSDLDQSIGDELEAAQIILLLVSAHFLASDYCYEREMLRAMEKHQAGAARVIPVIVHPCDWQSAPFGSLRATPTDARPLSMFANQQEAFAIVANDIRAAAESLDEPGVVSENASSPKADTNRGQEAVRSSNLRVRRKFDDHERDEFLENSYEYMARYFDGSLNEVSARNSRIKTRFKRLSSTSFRAAIYDGGERVAQCAVWYGGGTFGSRGIAYSSSGEVQGGMNESLSVVDDGYTLQLKPLGFQVAAGNQGGGLLSKQGAAELFWEMLIGPIQ